MLCTVFLLTWLLLLRRTGSRALGLSNCSAQSSLLHGMWDLPGPGIEPVSLALQGRFLTTGPPGKSYKILIYILIWGIYDDILFIFCLMAYRILVPWPGIKPESSALDGCSLNHWTAREVQTVHFFFFNHWLVYHCLGVPQFVYPFTYWKEHLSCFHFWWLWMKLL